MLRTVALYFVQPSSDTKGAAAMADGDAVLAMMHSSRWTAVRGFFSTSADKLLDRFGHRLELFEMRQMPGALDHERLRA
jgi:hypothetical protein